MLSARHVLVTLLILAWALPAPARALGFEKGIKLGVNSANFRGQFADLFDTKPKLGFVGGPYVAVGLGPSFTVQAEALYSMKGSKVTSQLLSPTGGSLGKFDTFINVDYIDVPILLRGTLLPTPVVTPVFYAGPTFGFPLQGKVDAGVRGTQTLKRSDLKSPDVGAAFGVGIGIRIGGQQLLADLRYTTGFNNVYKINRTLYSEPVAESINSVFSLMVGIGL
ncbi:MAG: PorT family protein [Acidobacteriia bacterium]|nr:PorT family protein [Terriglobia bacterium]